MKNKIYILVGFLLTMTLLFANFCYSQEEESFYVRTIQPASLFIIKNGQEIAWVNKGYKFKVIKKEGDWYLVKVSSGMIKEAWIKASDVEEITKDYIDLNEWGKVPLLIKDMVGDISSPNFCDFRSLKVNSDRKFIYFLIELAVGWKELFEKTKTTGSIGTIYLNADNDRKTGYDGGIIFANRDGKEERKIKEDDLRVGADYKIQIDTGIRSIVQRGRYKTIIPTVEYKLYSWKQEDLYWKNLDEGEPLFKNSFIEISISKEIIGLKDGKTVSLIFEEWNAIEHSRYNAASFTLKETP